MGSEIGPCRWPFKGGKFARWLPFKLAAVYSLGIAEIAGMSGWGL